MPQLEGADQLLSLLGGKDVLVGVIDVATDEIETPEQVAAASERQCSMSPRSASSRAPIAAWRRCGARWRRKLAALGQGAALARERFGCARRVTAVDVRYRSQRRKTE